MLSRTLPLLVDFSTCEPVYPINNNPVTGNIQVMSVGMGTDAHGLSRSDRLRNGFGAFSLVLLISAYMFVEGLFKLDRYDSSGGYLNSFPMTGSFKQNRHF